MFLKDDINMRIGVFGGSFDPIHFGHLILAEECRVEANLDQVIFVPAAQSPLKDSAPRSSNKQRLEMLSLALGGQTPFQISNLELERGGKSFTVDTLRELKEQHQDSELFLLIGQDSLNSFDRWKSPDQICQLATPLVIRRPVNHEVSKPVLELEKLASFVSSEQLDMIKELAMKSRLIEISSSDIRDRILNGKSVRYLLPRAVEKYIETQKLYLNRE